MWRYDELERLGEVEVGVCRNCDFRNESVGQRIGAERCWRESSRRRESIATDQWLAGGIWAAAHGSNGGWWHRTIDDAGRGSRRNIGSWSSGGNSGNSMVDGWRL